VAASLSAVSPSRSWGSVDAAASSRFKRRPRRTRPLLSASSAAPALLPSATMPGRPRDRYAAAACLLAPARGWLNHGAGATAGLEGGNGIYSLQVEIRPRKLAADRCSWWVLACGGGFGERREKS
jgi:hypothetical protein